LLETIPSLQNSVELPEFQCTQCSLSGIDWVKFANEFINETLGLERCQTTTQIEHYDNMAAFFDNLKRINTILTDLNRDIWAYISMDYFKQKVKTTETGSSTMPHKVNPIDFENSEGNLGLANAILNICRQNCHLPSATRPHRLNRDAEHRCTHGHSLIAYKSLLKGLNKLIINESKLKKDLDENWAVVSEAIQTILRRENYPNPYEALKELTRGHEGITKVTMHQFIDGLKVSKK